MPPPPRRRFDLHRLGILVGLASGAGMGLLSILVLGVLDLLALCLGDGDPSECPPARLLDEPEIYPWYLAATVLTLVCAVLFVRRLR